MFEWLQNFFLGNKENSIEENTSPDVKTYSLMAGIKTGRSSVDPNANMFSGITDLPADFNLEYLPIINFLSIFHHDISNAVSNVIDLGNTPYKIHLDDKVSPRNKRNALAHLKKREKTWSPYMNSRGTLVSKST